MMVKTSLPPGFRFHPTDVELVWYYLKKKIMGKPFRFEAISDVELYKFAPWDLPDKSCLQSRDLEWYFFCPRDRKYANGSRTNRATETGYWKTTGKVRQIDHKSQTVGMKRTLIFHIGKAPKGNRTDWVMHEYRLQSMELVNAGIPQEPFVLCKIFQKSGPGPKNGEQYGASFNEEDWNDFSDNEHTDRIPCFHWHDQSFLLDHVQRQPVTFEVGEPSSTPDLSEARELNSMLVQSVVSDVVEPSMEITEVGEPQSVPGHSYADGLAVSDVVEPSMENTELGEPQSMIYADGLFLEELQGYLNASPPLQGIVDDEILMSEVLCEDVNGVLDEDIETVYAQLDELSGPGIGLDDFLGQLGIGLDDFSFAGTMARDNALDLLSEISDEHYMELNDINSRTQPPELANPNAIGYPSDNSSSFFSANYHFGLTDFNSTRYPFANNSPSEDLEGIFVGNVLPTVGRGSDVDILTSEVPFGPMTVETNPFWMVEREERELAPI